MVKCNICGHKIEELFLKKIKGTIIRKPRAKTTYAVCFECQKKYQTKEELLEKV